MSSEVSRENRFTAFRRAGEQLAQKREEVIQRLKDAGHKGVVPCEILAGAIWVGNIYYLSPENAIKALGLEE